MIHAVSRGRGLIVFVILALAARESAGGQRPPAPSDGSNLQGWKVEHTGADIRDGVLRVKKGKGWVRTQRVYADFVLRLDVRIPADRAAAIFVRSWPTFDRSSAPTNAYRITFTGIKASQQSDGWQHLEVECIGGTVKVRADGVLVHSAEALRNPQGHIALSSPETTVEYKAIEISEVGLSLQSVSGALNVGNGVTAPRPRLQPSPHYTAAAMRAKITGTVVMQGVVQPDGTVKDVRLLQSLDPHFGLDQEALETASKWTFAPGMRDGQPVAVRIIIELDFNLKF